LLSIIFRLLIFLQFFNGTSFLLKTRIIDHENGLVLSVIIKLEPLKNKDEIIYIFGNKVVAFKAYVVIEERDRLITTDIMIRILGSNDKILSAFSKMPKRRGYIVLIL
jgi:hypothetical protein